MLKQETEQFSEVFEAIGQELDIGKAKYDEIVGHYKAVGKHLIETGSSLAPYNPEILPQGSFLLGTMIKPVNEGDDLDIDLVCRLEGKQPDWTQFDLKQAVGDRLKKEARYRQMLAKEEGKRCWTLQYSESSKFHMDILPSLVSKGYSVILEETFGKSYADYRNELAIRITDRTEENYRTERNPEFWPKSDPFGYALWFQDRATIWKQKVILFEAAVQPVPAYQPSKSILQRLVQILKRHRDIRFNGDDDRPISIIITTLAGLAYQKEENLLDALVGVVNRMPGLVGKKFDPKHGKMVTWIPNPVNPEENFADKWPREPQKEKTFKQWLTEVKIDIEAALSKRGQGLDTIKLALEQPFGKKTINEAFSRLGSKAYADRLAGSLRMDTPTGILGAAGLSIPRHTNHGDD